MTLLNFISGRDYLLSSELFKLTNETEKEISCLNKICLLHTKYGIDNIHNLILSNRLYKDKFKKIANECTDCSGNNNYLHNGMNCKDCFNLILNL